MAKTPKSVVANYRRQYSDTEAAPGWDAIDAKLETIYGAQEPRHWAPALPSMLGGPDPLDGISAYECTDVGVSHLHYCTYGYSSLYYDEASAGGASSGYGFEMTFRLASRLPPRGNLTWVVSLLQNLARYVFQTGNCFGANHWIPANGPIRAGHRTKLVGLAFVTDPTLGTIETPHGRVEFVQAFGITATELDRIMKKPATCEEIVEAHRKANPLLVTDLSRKDR